MSENLFRDAGTPVEPMTLRVDNQASLKRMNHEMEEGLTRYLAMRHMYVREKVISGELRLEWAETKKNVADIMIKPLGSEDFNRCQAMLGV
jgi:hypothetical protein